MRSPSFRTRSSQRCSSAARRSSATAGLRRAARGLARGCGRRARAGRRPRPLGRAGARAGRADGARERVRSRSASRTREPTSGSIRLVFEPFELPSIAVIGTGKRVGKTAVTGHWRGCSRATGRGRRRGDGTGRAAGARADRGRSLRRRPARALPRRPPRGVRPPGDRGRDRRDDGGLPSRRRRARWLGGDLERGDGARVARGAGPTSSSSTAAAPRLPPVEVDARVLVVGARQDRAVATGYLNDYRAPDRGSRRAHRWPTDAVVRGNVSRSARRALVRDGVPVIATVLRLGRSHPCAGKRVAFFGTAPPRGARPSSRPTCERSTGPSVVAVSGALADRSTTPGRARPRGRGGVSRRAEGGGGRRRRGAGARLGLPVVLVANDVVPLPGEPDLDGELERLATDAIAAVGGGRVTERRYLPELPLGGDEGPPWSKGLMARALAATGCRRPAPTSSRAAPTPT